MDSVPNAPVSDRVNILLIGKQCDKLDLHESMLSELGENLLRASSEREALELLVSTDVALVLVDSLGTGGNSIELISMIRQHSRTRNTAIVLVSANSAEEIDRVGGHDFGVLDIVPTNIQASLLRAKCAVYADLYRKTLQVTKLNEQLEEQVAARTADLEKALKLCRESESQLREANQRKDDFLAVLSHELRNPLAGIVGGIEVLEHCEMVSADAREMQQLITRQAKLMQRLLDDLLDVSRIARGKIVLNTAKINLTNLVAGVVSDLQREFSDVSQALELNLPAAPIHCKGDPARLTQVLVNVLQNARKFSDSGATTQVMLDAQVHDDMARIVVVDQGIGMDQETAELAFEPFAQAEHSLVRSRGGLGLGLAVAKRLIDEHGGEISIESRGVGFGTTVTILLPTLCAAEVSRDGDMVSFCSTTSFRVLIIDDRRDAVHPLLKMLQRSGHDVKVAMDGETGLKFATSFQPEVVICDIGLPDVDGYEVARRLRQMAHHPRLLLVAITGYGQEADRFRALEAGFDLHIAKPVGVAEVKRLLDVLSDRQLKPAREDQATC